MRVRKAIPVFFIFLFLTSPVSLTAQVPPPYESPPAIMEAEARKFLDEYIARYVRMDIDAFMGFFSKEAIENRMLTFEDIHDVYRGTFENSESLQYHLEIYSIQAYKQNTIVLGRYEVLQTLKGSNIKMVFRGNIQWELVREGGSLKIREISYGRDFRYDHPSHPYP